MIVRQRNGTRRGDTEVKNKLARTECETDLIEWRAQAKN
jgi:hypothetical protein